MKPQVPDCYDPVEQFRRNDLVYTARIMRRPRCLCCKDPIITEEYIDLEPFGIDGLACGRCIKYNTHYTSELEED